LTPDIHRTNTFVLLAAVALLAACAPMKKQAFNREAGTRIATLVLVQWASPEDGYHAEVDAHPGNSFGLIGGLIAEADNSSKGKSLTTAVKPQETRLRERMTARLQERLAAAGYTSNVFVLPPGTMNDERLVDSVKANAQGDALLIVNVRAGYKAAGTSTGYIPELSTYVKAVDYASKAVLYEDLFSYGYTTPQSQHVHFDADARYRFANIDALTADPARTRQAWYDGVDLIAAQIATDLRKNP
jgi:hypothetical protein